MELDAAQREALSAEVRALAGSLRDPASRDRYLALERAVAHGAVEDGLAAELQRLLEISLETGRARRMQGAEAERALLRLFDQTPRGALLRSLTDRANEALTALAGQTLSRVAFAARGPGAFRLEIETDLCQVAIEIGRSGVTVDSVAVGA